jgi:hypothetical protein
MPLLWKGLQQLEEAVSHKRAAATTYVQMGVFNRAHKDILGLCAALRYMGRRVLRCLPKRIKAEGDSYVLLREQHRGVLAVLEDPDWPEYERKMVQLQELQEQVDRSGVQDGAVAMLLRGARALPHLQLQGHATAVRRKHVAWFPVMARGHGCLPLCPHHAGVSCQPSWLSSTVCGHGGRMRTVARHMTLTWLWLRWRSAMAIVTVTTVLVSAWLETVHT